MAWDRMQAAEQTKVALMTQAALMIHSAVAAQVEGGGSSDSSQRLKEMMSQYQDLLAPIRVVERESALEEGKERLRGEEGKAYRIARADGGGGAKTRPRRGGLLEGRRKPRGA